MNRFLKNEIIELLNIKADGNYLDCTIGGAGHSSAIISHLKNGHLFGIDKDEDALCASRERLKNYSNFTLIHDDFKNIKEIFEKYEERIGSRIAGYYDIYYFFGNDIRFINN